MAAATLREQRLANAYKIYKTSIQHQGTNINSYMNKCTETHKPVLKVYNIKSQIVYQKINRSRLYFNSLHYTSIPAGSGLAPRGRAG